jgi:glycosyltransferase involved in cell wall biosynthesis
MIARRPRDRCNLLFVGIGWQRKGGDVAVEVARLLNERGLSTQLTLLGSDAPQDLPGFVNRLGFIDKKTPQGREQFNEVFGSSHFLLLPARAEAFGVVLCEAGSFGVPCIATRTGGIPTIVRNGENGMLFATDDPSRMADSIQNLFRDSRRYDAMAQSSFAEYRARLNWNVAGRTVKELLTSL